MLPDMEECLQLLWFRSELILLNDVLMGLGHLHMCSYQEVMEAS